MTKQKLGLYLTYAAYGLLIGGGVFAAHHPLIITLVLLGAAAFFMGRQLEKS